MFVADLLGNGSVSCSEDAAYDKVVDGGSYHRSREMIADIGGHMELVGHVITSHAS